MTYFAPRYPSPLKQNNVDLDIITSKILSHFRGQILGRRFAIWGSSEDNSECESTCNSMKLALRLSSLGASATCHFRHETLMLRNQRISAMTNKLDVVRKADALVVLADSSQYRGISWDPGLLAWLMNSLVIFDAVNCLEKESLRFGSTIYYNDLDR